MLAYPILSEYYPLRKLKETENSLDNIFQKFPLQILLLQFFYCTHFLLT